MLIDATLKHAAPPLALPEREFMERARAIWDELGPAAAHAAAAWHGYSLGDWAEDWDISPTRRRGEWEQNGTETFARRRGGVTPETPVRDVEGK